MFYFIKHLSDNININKYSLIFFLGINFYKFLYQIVYVECKIIIKIRKI